MIGEKPLPAFTFRADHASVWTTIRQGIGDVGSIIPASILTEPAVQLAGPGAPLVVASPELAREVLNDRASQFTRDRFVRRMFRRSWGNGLAAAEGEAWQRQRRAAVPFFTPRAVNTHLRAFAAASDAVFAQLSDGKTIDPEVLAARIVARIVLTVLVDAQGAVDPDEAAADIPAYVRKITAFGPIDLLPLPERLIDRLRGIDTDPAVIRLRELGARLSQARAGAGAPLNDMIALLEAKGPLEDNIRGLFPAAIDTTVAGLGWAFNTLAQREDWQEKVAAEGRTLGDAPTLEKLPVTRRVVSEVLRLYPPAPLLARCAAQDMDLGGYPVSARQTVLVAIYAMQRHRSLWDNPDAFDPDRFLANPAPDAWMPFGSGPRMCIAAHFAQAEMAVVLARVLASGKFLPVDHVPDVSLRTTTRSLNGLAAKMVRRS